MTDTGRIRGQLTPSAQRIVFSPPSDAALEAELRALTEIDRAHVLMLCRRAIVGEAPVRALLLEIGRLRASGFVPLRARPMTRGLYLMYESYLIETLGEDSGGVLQTARSRNDLNATLVRLRLRGPYHALLSEMLRLQAVLLRRARMSSGMVMPMYTHYQPALPITLGHYLLGVAGALDRSASALRRAAHDIDSCPLGAGAGGGTVLPIDTTYTAARLGFRRRVRHSLDAVASRDVVLNLLGQASVIGVLLSRLAADLLLWTTNEFGFLELPDECVGSSSMMPQKRNPFLLEHVQGLSSAPLGAFVAAATAVHAKPFTNSIAVGTEAVGHVWRALSQLTEAVTLSRLVVAKARPRPDLMSRRATEGYTYATHLANRLVTTGEMPFRSAHRVVGELVRAAVEAGAEPLSAAADRLWPEARARLSRVFDPGGVIRDTRYGGGPGALAKELARLESAWSRHRRLKRIQAARWRRAEMDLEREVCAFCEGVSSPACQTARLGPAGEVQ